MIYYISLDNDQPSGGVKTQYRHVEILNKHDLPATMLHQTRGFSGARKWFESKIRLDDIQAISETVVNPGDVLVWPEILLSSVPVATSHRIRNVIFNQNVHYTFRSNPGPDYSLSGAVDGTMVLTDYERDFLLWAVPGHRVGVVRHGIDPGIFGYDGRQKKAQIAFMPRKHPDEAQAVFGWLSQLRALEGWNLVAIDQSTEKQTAEIMKDSAYFFAFGYPEGGTLPPFEALSAGCMVVGYGGFASDGLLEAAGGSRIDSGDTCRFAHRAVTLLQGGDRLYDSETCFKRSKHVLEMFNLKQEEDSLVRFMKEFV